MSKRVQGRDRLGEGGPQDGPTGQGSEVRQDRKGDDPGGALGIGGQRHRGGSSRDPQTQARRTKEKAHG